MMHDTPIGSSVSNGGRIASPSSGGLPGGGAAAAGGGAAFESNKREATKLERQLEEKITKYQQLSQRYTSLNQSNMNSNVFNRSIEMGGGSGGAKNGNHQQDNKNNLKLLNQEEGTLKHDIQRSLRYLQDYIENKLVPLAETNHQKHLVKRYREIWLDSSQDFEKSRSIIQRYRDRIELFAESNAANSNDDDDEETAGMDALLRERNHISNSINSTTSILEQAANIHHDLRSQGMSLSNVGGKIGSIISTIPGLNTLVDKIRSKRSRDDKILSIVIASCLFFTFWYLFG